MPSTITTLRDTAQRARTSEARCVLAEALLERGQREEAVEVLRAAASAPDGDARAWRALGYALAFDFANVITPPRGFSDAERCFRRAIELAPDHREAYIALSDLYDHAADDLEMAERTLIDGLACAAGPRVPYIRLARLAVLRYGEEEADARLRAHVPDTERPSTAHLALANGYSRCGRYDAAEREYERLAAHDPDSLDALLGLGYMASVRRDLERAQSYFDEACRRYPRHDGPLLHQLQHLCRRGRYDEAQQAFRAWWPGRPRPRTAAAGVPPDWDGDDLEGRTVLIPAWRGGFGDGLHFNQFAGYLQERGATVIAECRQQILPLIAAIPGVAAAVLPFDERPPIDVQCRSYFINLLLDWTWASWHERQPMLRTDPELVRRCRARLGTDGRLRVGIGWRCGHVEYRHDPYFYRAMPLEALRPLAANPDVQLVSLQFEASREIADVFGEGVVLDDRELVRGFAATAALVSCLDAVVTVDTATAHLAGGLGAPGWLMLPHFGDWRWFADEERCWFYPSLELVRSPAPGDWASGVARIERRLRTLTRTRASASRSAP